MKFHKNCVICHVHSSIKGGDRPNIQRDFESKVVCEMSSDTEDDSIEKYLNGVG